MIITIQPYTKKLLAQILGISSKSLGRWLSVNKSKLLDRFPNYKITDKRLHPDVFKFICKEHGVSSDEIVERFKVLNPSYEQLSIEKIKGMYDLYS